MVIRRNHIYLFINVDLVFIICVQHLFLNNWEKESKCCVVLMKGTTLFVCTLHQTNFFLNKSHAWISLKSKINRSTILGILFIILYFDNVTSTVLIAQKKSPHSPLSKKNVILLFRCYFCSGCIFFACRILQ